CMTVQARPVLDVMPQRADSSLWTARAVHGQGLRLGISSHGKLGSSISELYARCGHVNYAEKMLFGLETRDEMAWNSFLVMKSRRRLFKDVLKDFALMWSSGVVGNQYSFATVLSACGKLMNLNLGMQVHCGVVKAGLEADAYCEGSLIDMYAKCHHLVAAKRIFDASKGPDTVSWTAIVSGFAQVGLATEAMHIFDEMLRTRNVVDRVMFVTVLNAFVSQGRLDHASILFPKMLNPDVVAWNLMISAHLKSGDEVQAIKIFKNMIDSGILPSRSSLGSVLSAVASMSNYEYGLQIHALAVKLGLESNVYAGSSLLNMYAKCKRMGAARAVFDALEDKNDVLWNALLGGYSQNGQFSLVFELFMDMRTSEFQPDEFTYTSVISACACLEDIETGVQLHSVLIKNGFEENLYVQNSLVDMYAKSGYLPDARKLFERMHRRDNVSWNAIIVGCVHEEQEEEAFLMFRRMISQEMTPDEVSLASILSAASNVQDLCKGMQIHCFLIKYGLERGLYAGCSLVDMYCKSGMTEAAEVVFSSMPERNVVCVNTLISGFAQRSSSEKAVNAFKCMLSDGLQPSEITFATLLEASSSANSDLHFGQQLHCFIVKLGIPNKDEFLAVSLLGMYINSGRNADADRLFFELPLHDSTIIWTVMISENSQMGYGKEALSWHREMHRKGVKPDQATFASVVKACSISASLEDGKKTHCLIFHAGYDRDELTGSALVDMYSKCGDMKSSAQVFREMDGEKDLIAWNSMIVGYAKNGFAECALKIFYEMQRANVRPDEVTLLGVLTACSHSGMVTEGRDLYSKMVNSSSSYMIQPRADHCACMVDLLGRWGYLDEAEMFINNMEFEPDSMIWSTFLHACRLHGDDLKGKVAAQKLLQLEPQNSSAYLLLSHMHAASGNWDDVGFLRRRMIQKGVAKFPGTSRI
ncbi:hypothetical protein M569_09060, partial [Genlisea aurea]